MKAPASTVVFLTSCVFAISPAVAFGQHGGGGHASGGNVASASSHSSISSRTTISGSTSHSSQQHSPVVVVSGRSEQELGMGSDRWASESGNSSGRALNDRWLSRESENETRAHGVTIGFPRTAESDSSHSASRDMAFVSERGNMWKEQVQRGARPVAPVNRPAATAPAAPQAASPSSRAVIHPLSLVRSLQVQPRRALWFLSPSLNGNGSRIVRRRFFGGFGFFGFGLPFAYGFGPDCNPFWAEPFAFGCNTLGYFGGYGGYGFAPQEENEVEPSQEQYPETNVFVPQDQSSPEEIQAEKVLFVLYMKNGALYALTNYWIEDGKLHYLTSYGGENTIDMDDIDLQKTVDVNAKRGLDFTLKPRSEQGKSNESQQ